MSECSIEWLSKGTDWLVSDKMSKQDSELASEWRNEEMCSYDSNFFSVHYSLIYTHPPSPMRPPSPSPPLALHLPPNSFPPLDPTFKEAVISWCDTSNSVVCCVCACVCVCVCAYVCVYVHVYLTGLERWEPSVAPQALQRPESLDDPHLLHLAPWHLHLQHVSPICCSVVPGWNFITISWLCDILATSKWLELYYNFLAV